MIYSVTYSQLPGIFYNASSLIVFPSCPSFQPYSKYDPAKCGTYFFRLHFHQVVYLGLLFISHIILYILPELLISNETFYERKLSNLTVLPTIPDKNIKYFKKGAKTIFAPCL